MRPDEMAQLSATELSMLLTKRDISPVELTQAYIDRAHRYARLNAYITLDEEGAMQLVEYHFLPDLHPEMLKRLAALLGQPLPGAPA